MNVDGNQTSKGNMSNWVQMKMCVFGGGGSCFPITEPE